MKKTFFLILLVILIILIVVFTLQNSDNVSIKFFTLEFTSSLSLIVFLTFTFGIMVAILALSPSMLKDSKLRKTMKKEIKRLESEMERYRVEKTKEAGEKKRIIEAGIDDDKKDTIYYKQ